MSQINENGQLTGVNSTDPIRSSEFIISTTTDTHGGYAFPPATGRERDSGGGGKRVQSKSSSFNAMSEMSRASPMGFMEQFVQSLQGRSSEGSSNRMTNNSSLDESMHQKAWESSSRGSQRRSIQILDDEFNFKDEPPMTGVMGSLGVGVLRGLAEHGSSALGSEQQSPHDLQKWQEEYSRELMTPRRTISTESIKQQKNPHEQIPKRTISTESLLRRQALIRQQLLTSAGEIVDITQSLQRQHSGARNVALGKISNENEIIASLNVSNNSRKLDSVRSNYRINGSGSVPKTLSEAPSKIPSMPLDNVDGQAGCGSMQWEGLSVASGSQGGCLVGSPGQLFVQDVSGRLIPIQGMFPSSLGLPHGFTPHPLVAPIWSWACPQVFTVSIGVFMLIANIFAIMFMFVLNVRF